uniref:Subtilase family protein n=1 Tax=Rhizophora mucronata TaxID=61149 RepID=A0A2P2LLU2_RHIMU
MTHKHHSPSQVHPVQRKSLTK